VLDAASEEPDLIATQVPLPYAGETQLPDDGKVLAVQVIPSVVDTAAFEDDLATPIIDTGATGVTLSDADDAVEVPLALVAVTVNVYAVPLVRPDTVIIPLLALVPVKPPGLEVAVNTVNAFPPLSPS
jgi:hypothetical protein